MSLLGLGASVEVAQGYVSHAHAWDGVEDRRGRPAVGMGVGVGCSPTDTLTEPHGEVCISHPHCRTHISITEVRIYIMYFALLQVTNCSCFKKTVKCWS